MTDKLRKKEAKMLFKKAPGEFTPVDLSTASSVPGWMTRAYKNNRYVVMINDREQMTKGVTAIKAMIQRHDNKPITGHWKELQRIKNELFGKEVTGIEFYPAESQLIDDFNIYWLWVLPEYALPTYPMKLHDDILPRAVPSAGLNK